MSELIVIIPKGHKFKIEESDNLAPGTILVIPPRRLFEPDDELIARSIIIRNLAP